MLYKNIINMARNKYIIFLLITFLAIIIEVKAQNTTDFYGMTWYLDKSEVFKAARLQGKQVLLLWGRITCPNCQQTKKYLAGSLKSIVDEHYLLWFSDCDANKRDSPDLRDYISGITGGISLPLLCIIDTYDTTVAYGMSQGFQTESQLRSKLNEYVSNDNIVEDEKVSAKVYIAENSLVIKSGSTRELIQVYAITGSLTDKFYKTDHNMTRDISLLPNGIYIVRGSSGWAQKIIVR